MVIRINKKTWKYLFAILSALSIGLLFFIDRNMNMDFNRYQDMMDTIRNSGMSLSDFLSDETHMLKWSNITLPFMYSFNVLLYFVATHFRNNYVLVWISVLIDYSVVAYIAYDWKRDDRYSLCEIISSILICFAFLPIIHVCSGLRTATSGCFMALAVYCFLYRNKGILLFTILCGISVTFHPFSVFAIPIAIVIKITQKKYVFYTTVIGCLFISRIVSVLSKSSITFLRSLATKYITYTSEGQYRAYRFALYGTIVFSFVCVLYYLFVYQKQEDTNSRYVDTHWFTQTKKDMDYHDKERLFLFFSSYMALLIGNIKSYEMVCRGIYIVGASAPILSDLLFGDNNTKYRNITVLTQISVFILLIYVCLCWIRYYHSYFVL